MNRRALSCGMAALAFAGMTGCGNLGAGQNNDDVVNVGLSAAFSGTTAYYGQDSQRGIELAIQKLKKTMPDEKFDLSTVDDECTPQGGASAFRKLTDLDNVDVILGSPCSSGTLGGMPTLTRSKVPALTFGATNPKISQQSGVGGNRYMWRMNIDDSIMGRYWAKYIADAGAERVAVLAANNDYGRAANDIYATLLPRSGVQLATTQFYDPGASDFRAQLTKIQAAGTNGLIVFAEPPDCGQMLRQMTEMGMKVQIYSRGGCADPEALEATGNPKIADGVLDAAYWTATDSQRDFLDAYKKAYGGDAPYNAALAYYGMLTVAEAVKAGGGTAAGIEKGLGEVDFDSGIGPVTFDDHHQAHPDMFILQVENGRVRVLKTVRTGR